MILLFFIITLATAIHYELSRFTPITSNVYVAFTYFVGSIFFMIWTEPYIMPNTFYILAFIQVVSFLVNSINQGSFAYKWNKVESKVTLSILVLAVLYTIKYFHGIMHT